MKLSPEQLVVGLELVWQGTLVWRLTVSEVCPEYGGFYLEGHIWHTFKELETWEFLEVAAKPFPAVKWKDKRVKK